MILNMYIYIIFISSLKSVQIFHLLKKIKLLLLNFFVVQSLSHVWLCDPMDCSTPGFPVLHYLPEFAQTRVHWAKDAIQSSHSLSPTSPPALSLSQHQGLFQWVSFLHQVAKVLELQLQHQSFNEYSGLISFSFDLVWSPCCLRASHHSWKASILWRSAFIMVHNEF